VRAVRRAELGFFVWDFALLMLERVRLVDISNKWASNTLKGYQSKYNIFAEFDRTFHTASLPATRLSHPPKGPSISTMWTQEWYMLFPADWRRKNPLREKNITFGTGRGLRSAASHFWLMDLLYTHPENLTAGFKERPTFVERCNPTDELMYTYFTEGLRRRIGDHPNPSTVLQDHHIHWINRYYQSMYQHAPTQMKRIEAARAGVTHLVSYLGWLRAMETFGIRWCDLTIVRPEDGPTIGWPYMLGAILLELLEQTKSSQHAVADVVVACTTYSGLSLGNWLALLSAELPPGETQSKAFVLCDPSGSAWTSHLYRHKFFYPALYACQASGDPFLQQFNGIDRPTIPTAFWSFNTQRRTGRSNVSKKRLFTYRAAFPAEVVEHSRWHLSRSSLDMPLAYLEWSVEDRVCVTFLCA
jgi:hypothetical protein